LGALDLPLARRTTTGGACVGPFIMLQIASPGLTLLT